MERVGRGGQGRAGQGRAGLSINMARLYNYSQLLFYMISVWLCVFAQKAPYLILCLRSMFSRPRKEFIYLFIMLTLNVFPDPEKNVFQGLYFPVNVLIFSHLTPLSTICVTLSGVSERDIRAATWQNQQNECAPRLIWVFTRRTVTLLVLSCRGS